MDKLQIIIVRHKNTTTTSSSSSSSSSVLMSYYYGLKLIHSIVLDLPLRENLSRINYNHHVKPRQYLGGCLGDWTLSKSFVQIVKSKKLRVNKFLKRFWVFFFVEYHPKNTHPNKNPWNVLASNSPLSNFFAITSLKLGVRYTVNASVCLNSG